MGNRCVITTEENFRHNGVGVYLHWNGGRDSVEAFLTYCEMKGFRSPDIDCYGWARLAQVCANFFGGTDSVGIDTVDSLDCKNGDNGVYIIKGWKIVDRKYFHGSEQNEYDLEEMLIAIDENMPENDRLGKDFLSGKIVRPDEMKIGDTISFLGWSGTMEKYVVLGFGTDMMVNGHNVKGVPFVAKFGTEYSEIVKNPNNYLFADREYRKLQ